MSRLIVKNLPKKITDTELRAHFASHGQVTDCCLKYTPDGRFRQFAFVGYANETDAMNAKQFYDRTFIGSNRLEVDICQPFAAANKPRAWSRNANDTHQSTGDDGKKRTSKNTKQNASEIYEPADAAESEIMRTLLQNYKHASNSSAVFITGLPEDADRDRVKAFLAPVRPKSVQTQTVPGKAYALVTLRACDQQRVLKRDGEEYAGEKLGIHAPPTDHHHVAACTSSGNVAKGNVKADAARILDTGRLFARSLPPTVTEEALREVFAQFGDIADVKLPRARDGKLKGFAVITFMFPEHALQAYTQLDGQIFQGRNLFLVPGEEAREEHVDAPIVDGAPSTFKKEKGKKQKNTAVSGHNWNALFLGTNAVADSMALQLNTDKSALLDAEAHASLAVRMALGETNMVRNTRTFLMKHGEWEQCLADVYVRAGVQLDAFGQTNGVRSRNVILVKNLPMNTDVDALRTTFSQHGQVGRVLLPPDGGITAIVEYTHEHEAAKAFKQLAYSRFGSVPLYLEWAPDGVFVDAVIERNEQQLRNEDQGTSEQPPPTTDDAADSPPTEELCSPPDKPVDEPAVDDTCATVFVKNLAFETTDEQLCEKLGGVDGFVSATISKKRDVTSGQMLSMGYAFLTLRTHAHAVDAIKRMQNTSLHGHRLELKLSNRQMKRDSVAPTNKRGGKTEQGESTKILVRNVPFQANATELTDLFTTFGEVTFVRLPTKTRGGKGNEHRGFAFVQFATKATARRAFDALVHSTHLYGRRLVLEWADEAGDGAESLEQARTRVARRHAAVNEAERRPHAKRHLNETLHKLDMKKQKMRDEN